MPLHGFTSLWMFTTDRGALREVEARPGARFERRPGCLVDRDLLELLLESRR